MYITYIYNIYLLSLLLLCNDLEALFVDVALPARGAGHGSAHAERRPGGAARRGAVSKMKRKRRKEDEKEEGKES